MRRTLFSPYSNPIARREISAYQRGVPLWMRRCDTVGIVAVSLATCLYLIVRWLYERPNAWIWMIYQQMGRYTFDVMAYLQLTAGILYGCVLLRCIAAGINVAHRYRSYHRDDLVLTGLDDRQILFGQWYSALYQVRGWMVALGLVRIAVMLVMAADYQFNIYWDHVASIARNGELRWAANAFDYSYHPLQFPLILTFIIVLGLFEVWGAIGVGLLAGTWIRRGLYAAITAIMLRALPILIFTWFPTIWLSDNPYDWLVLRWQEYTWFAFVDGGMGAVLRLTPPAYWPYRTAGYFFARSTLAFLAAVHMLLIYGMGAYILSSLRWRHWGSASEWMDRKPLITPISANMRHSENVLVILAAAVVCVGMCLAWRDGPHIPPALGANFRHNPGFLSVLQGVIGIAMGITSLRTIYAGVYAGQMQTQITHRPVTMRDFLSYSKNLCGQLRGWILGLGIIIITGYGLLITENMINLGVGHYLTCDFRGYVPFPCFSPTEKWSLSQWVLGFTFSIILSFIISFSSICIGVGSGIVFHRPLVALITAIGIRALPVLINMMTPDIQAPDHYTGLLIPRWNHDTVSVFADTGISALLGIGEPGWVSNTQYGLTHIGFGLLAFTLVIYMLLGYIALSLIAVRVKNRHSRTIAARLVSEVQP